MRAVPARRQSLVHKVFAVGIAVLLLSAVAYLAQNSVHATPSLDWTAPGQPVINSSKPVAINIHQTTNQPGCTYREITIRSKYTGIIGESQTTGCVVRGEHLLLAHTSDGLYVSLGSDRYFYRFHTDNTGIVPYGVVLAPGTDRIGFQMSMIGYDSIRIYDDFSSRITLDKNTLRYHMTNLENRLFPADEQATQYGVSMNLSNNGRYMVYQSGRGWPGTYQGVIRVDLETGEQKQFGYAHYSDYANPLPLPHYAISNDGSSVAGGGISAVTVWSLSEACVKDFAGNSNQAPEVCPSRTISSEEYVGLPGDSWYKGARTHGVQFNDDASELSFIFQLEDDGGFKRINLSPAGYVAPKPQLDYLALGDSYSSGEGDTERDKRTDKKYYRLWTDIEEDKAWDQPREKCHISTRSYPYILAKGMSLGDPASDSSTKWQSVACSGARIYDVSKMNSKTYKGQGKGSGKLWDDGSIPRLEGYDVNMMKTVALNEFIPGRHKQIKFVGEYKPKVITLTIGGNDLGFGEKITECITSISTCDIAREEYRADLAKQIRDKYDDLKPFYEELYEESDKKAKIFVLGYPQFINGNLGAACKANKGALNDQERKAIKESVTYFNSTIEQAAKAAGIKYIDIEDSLQNGRLCDEGQRYVTGVSMLGGSERQESIHPNARGNYQIAMKIWEEVNNESLLDYDICPESDEDICPDESATKEAITIPPYFQVAEPGYSIEYAGDMTSGSAAKGSPLEVIRSSYSFEPGSTVEFTLFSDPLELGGYQASSDGSLNINVKIPDSVPVGYHTLVADGITYSGEPIRYEQIILVQGANPDDIDEDGVPDSEQACGPFMAASGVDADLDGIDDACDPQISEQPELYRWRFGYPERTYNGSPEDESQVYIERNIWAGAVTGIADDYDADGDGWAVVGVSQVDQLSGVGLENSESTIDFEVLGNGAAANPYEPILYVYPNTQQCKAYSPTNLGRVVADEIRTLSIAQISNEKCPQELVDDSDFQEPDPKPPKNEGLFDRLRNNLHTIRVQINNLISTLVNQLRMLLMPLRW